MSLLDLIKNILVEDFSNKSIEKILKYCYSISLSTWNKLVNEIFDKKRISINDSAINSVVKLITKNGNEKSRIERYLYNKKNNLESEADVKFCLNKLIWETVENDICWEFAFQDERFENIYLNLILLLKTSTYKRFFNLSYSYIIPESKNQTNGYPIDFESFNKLPDHLFIGELKIVIENMLNYLKEKAEFLPAIPLIPFILKLKKSNSLFNLDININQ